eukprot:jgi/Mesvir1/17672/Mv01371-RA.1
MIESRLRMQFHLIQVAVWLWCFTNRPRRNPGSVDQWASRQRQREALRVVATQEISLTPLGPWPQVTPVGWGPERREAAAMPPATERGAPVAPTTPMGGETTQDPLAGQRVQPQQRAPPPSVGGQVAEKATGVAGTPAATPAPGVAGTPAATPAPPALAGDAAPMEGVTGTSSGSGGQAPSSRTKDKALAGPEGPQGPTLAGQQPARLDGDLEGRDFITLGDESVWRAIQAATASFRGLADRSQQMHVAEAGSLVCAIITHILGLPNLHADTRRVCDDLLPALQALLSGRRVQGNRVGLVRLLELLHNAILKGAGMAKYWEDMKEALDYIKLALAPLSQGAMGTSVKRVRGEETWRRRIGRGKTGARGLSPWQK